MSVFECNGKMPDSRRCNRAASLMDSSECRISGAVDVLRTKAEMWGGTFNSSPCTIFGGGAP
jgi:hypothetical protein